MTPQEEFFVQLVRERALVEARDLELALRLREERGPGASIPDLLVGLGCLSVSQRESLLAETRPRPFSARATDTPTLAGVGDTVPAPVPSAPRTAAFPGYEVLEEIAHGGMGIVYKARQIALGRTVALKVLIAGEHASPDMLERFHRESRSAARLDHPNIVHVYDAAQDGNVHFFTMRLVDGLPLSHIAREKPLSPRRALEVARTVALALDYAHRQGVIHRDVKPANILIDAAGEPHVADFGLAKDTADGATMSAATLGTPSYASPEQVAGQRDKVDARTDVYGLGATLYEMLTGRPPFVGDSVFTVIADVLGADPVPPRSLNPSLHRDAETICLKALEKSPSRRYASAGAMAEDIRRHLDGEPILARPVSRAERLVRLAAKNRAVVLLALAAVLLGGGWAAWWDLTASEREDERSRTRTAELALDKAQRVSRVLARWARLADDVKRIEAAAYDPSLSAEARRACVAEPWLRVQAFLADTPSDSASRAAARALAGWARLLAEGQEAGFADFREAASIDPDVPYSWLFEGLARFCQLIRSLPLPTIENSPSGIRTGAVPPETPEQAAEREEVRRLLGRARRATVWGKEGAEGLSAAFDAVVAMHDGDWARAESGLSRALETPDLRIAESGLLLARARARYLKGDFDGAQEDLAHVLRARPESAEAYEMLAQVKLGQVVQMESTGGEPGPGLKVAIDALGQTLGRRPQDASAYKTRGDAYRSLGLSEEAHGEDPRPSWKLAIDDLDEAIRLAPGSANAWSSRGVVRQHLAGWMSRHGEDGSATLARGIEDLAKALSIDPDHVVSLVNRGSALLDTAEMEVARGEDPMKTLDRANVDLSRAIRIDPRQSQALNNRGLVHLDVGERGTGRGIDPTVSFQEAVADFDASLALEPAYLFPMNNKGIVFRDLAAWQAGRGDDPRPSWDKAVAAFDAALARNADYLLAWQNRGQIRWKRGEWEAARGEDPSETYGKAEGDFGEALARNPRSVDALNCRGIVRWRRGEWEMGRGVDPTARLEGAIADLGAAIALCPTSSNFFNNRGNVSWSLGDWRASKGVDPSGAYDKALVDFGESTRLAPGYAEAHNGRGIVLWRRGEWESRQGKPARASWEKAIAEFDEVLRIAPGHGGAPGNRGNVWSRIGDLDATEGKDPRNAFEKAERDFDASLARSSGAAGRANGLGIVRLHRANWEALHGIDPRAGYREAIASFGDALTRNPQFTLALGNRSEAWRRLGDAVAAQGEDATEAYTKGVEDAEKAVALNATDKILQEGLQEVRKSLADWQAKKERR